MKISIAVTTSESPTSSQLKESAKNAYPEHEDISVFSEYFPDLKLTGSIPACESVLDAIACGILYRNDFCPDSSIHYATHCDLTE